MGFQRATFVAPALLAASLALAPSARAGETSTPDAVFVPGSYVPLSEYRHKIGPSIELNVHPDVVTWAGSGTLRVAVRKTNGTVVYKVPDSVAPSGLVSLTHDVTGKAVVVSTAVTQDTSIVTHWDESTAKQSQGATGALRQIKYDSSTGSIIKVEPTPPIDNRLAGGTYMWNTASYALFSDGSGKHDTKQVPDLEVYIGENYAVSAPKPMALVALSDHARAATGRPVAHFNPGSALYQSAPLFQIVHAYVVPYDDGDPDNGNEQSLGSFLLPPGWAPAGGPYPVLFEGFYDIHNSTFLTTGPRFLEVLGALHDHPSGPRRVVGVLWNGGGAEATTALHPSAYPNAELLFAEAAATYGADTHQVVVTGGSRGGTTALAVAANPNGYTSYSVQYAYVGNPQLKLGEAVQLFTNATYPGANLPMEDATGYLGAWETGWTSPGGQTADAIVLHNLVGATTAQEADDASPFGFVDELLSTPLGGSEARILLSLGTHDYIRSYAHSVEFVEVMRAAGLRVQVELYYRGGHNGVPPGTGTPTEEDLLNMLFDGTSTLVDQTLHFRPDVPTAPHTSTYSAFTPQYLPLVVELPILVQSGDLHTITFVGEPGANVLLETLAPGGQWTTYQNVTLSMDTFGRAVVQVPAPTASSLEIWSYRATYDACPTCPTLEGLSVASATMYSTQFAIRPNPWAGSHENGRCGGLGGDEAALHP